MKTVDVGSLLDEGQWSPYQKLLVAGAALTIVLDGLDNQVLGAAVPALMREWSLPRAAFATQHLHTCGVRRPSRPDNLRPSPQAAMRIE